MTGIDRVEFAYFRFFEGSGRPLFGLVKGTNGVSLLDPIGMSALLARFEGRQPWGRRDVQSRLRLRQPVAMQSAMSDLRRLSVKQPRYAALSKTLADLFPDGCSYLDVGHTKPKRRIFEAIQGLPEARLIFMLHDVIPLDYPQYQTPQSVRSCEIRVALLGEIADLMIYPSAHSRSAAEVHLKRYGRVPPSRVIALGVEPFEPCPADLPVGLDLDHPYFVSVGTIEPRKNHLLLLDLWKALSRLGRPPTLFLVGGRGWQNAEVFAKLDANPTGVVELNGISDGAMTALLAKASALLFPSHAEGFGLPPAEAASLGVPVLCSDLPVFREVLGSYPVYLPPTDLAAWQDEVQKIVSEKDAGNVGRKPDTSSTPLPNWDNHFKIVSNLV